MQHAFGQMDGYKLSWLISEAFERIRFLACINVEDETSSELAGYEINKLLKEEFDLEERYSELLKVRGTLKGISNKRKLQEIQSEVEEVALALKENTKKLGRLFRENPDLKKEAEKVANERVQLVTKLGTVFAPLQQTVPTFNPIQLDLISELDDQDSLRQLILKEKGLLAEIKNLHALLKQEEIAKQNEINEKEINVQTRKEALEKARSDSKVEKKNLQEEVDAKFSTKKRIQDQAITDLEAKIEKLRERKNVEVQVFTKIADFLKQKESEKKDEIQQWSAKLEDTRQAKQDEIDKLNDVKAKALEELRKLKEEFDNKNNSKIEKERKVLSRDEEKRRKLEEEERIDEAVKRIQENYRGWKEGGGVVKKKKGKKGKKGGAAGPSKKSKK